MMVVDGTHIPAPTGKSMFWLEQLKAYLKEHPNAEIVYLNCELDFDGIRKRMDELLKGVNSDAR